jgi:hypothetical protein
MQKIPYSLFKRNNRDPFALPGRRSCWLEVMRMNNAAMAGHVQCWQSCSIVGRSSVARVSKGRVGVLKVVVCSVMLRDALRALSTNGARKSAFRSKNSYQVRVIKRETDAVKSVGTISLRNVIIVL